MAPQTTLSTKIQYGTENPIPSSTKPDDIFKLYQNPTILNYGDTKTQIKGEIIGGNAIINSQKKPTPPSKVWSYSGTTPSDVSGSYSNGVPVLPSPSALSSEFSSVLSRIQGILANAQSENSPNVTQILTEIGSGNNGSINKVSNNNILEYDPRKKPGPVKLAKNVDNS